ncbi:MAG: hypothetical protein R6W31_14280 [Bacteroidales bacterium]
MKMKTIPLWLFICFLAIGPVCNAQNSIEIPAPTIELKGNKIHITYDILNSQPSEIFNIQLEIQNEEGAPINAKAFYGDIGGNVSGGTKKSIIWDLEADNIFLNAEIFINIYAEKVILPTQSTQGYKRTSLILQSVAFPGLGLTKVKGKPHWIKGLAAYGCLGGAIALNRMAISSYDDFLAAETVDDANALYTKASRQDVISESLAFVAIGIWVTDLVWTIIGTSNDHQKISFNGGYSAMTHSPIIEISYKF